MEEDEELYFHGFKLEEFSDVEKAKALITHLDLYAEDGETITQPHNTQFLVNDPPKDNRQTACEYEVMTDEEADKYCEDYLEDNRDMWVEAVKADRTDSSWEDWKSEVLRNDGRGSVINHYDGTEEDVEINGTTYYIYRTN